MWNVSPLIAKKNIVTKKNIFFERQQNSDSMWNKSDHWFDKYLME